MGFFDELTDLNEKMKEIDGHTGQKGSGWVIFLFILVIIAIIACVFGGK